MDFPAKSSTATPKKSAPGSTLVSSRNGTCGFGPISISPVTALIVQVDYFRVRHEQDIILGLQEGLLRCAIVLLSVRPRPIPIM